MCVVGVLGVALWLTSKLPPSDEWRPSVRSTCVEPFLLLAECGSTRSGRKAILQRRLHALIVQAAIEQSVDNTHGRLSIHIYMDV